MAKVRLWRKITPQQLNVRGMKQALKETMQEIADDIMDDFHKTTESWEHQPKFYDNVQTQGGPMGNKLMVEVYTEDEQYGWVNDGTPPHWEEPVNAQALAFTYQSSPKTMPGVIDSWDFSPGDSDVLSMGMVHPGAKARNFDKTIAGDWRKEFRRRTEPHMKKVAERSGHSMRKGSSESRTEAESTSSIKTFVAKSNKSFAQQVREAVTKAGILFGFGA